MKVIWPVRGCHCLEVLLVEKGNDDKEPVVSMDHVSIRKDNTILVYILWLAGIKNTADAVN